MMMFVVVWLILSVSVGAFFSLMIVGGMKDSLKKTILGIVIALAFGFVVTGTIHMETVHDEKVWNGGQCVCGGSWELKGVTRTRHGSTTYYWECSECLQVIETLSKLR